MPEVCPSCGGITTPLTDDDTLWCVKCGGVRLHGNWEFPILQVARKRQQETRARRDRMWADVVENMRVLSDKRMSAELRDQISDSMK